MSEVVLKKVNEIKVGNFILVDGVVCRVVKIDVSKAGKHGSAKARIETVSLKDGRKKVVLKSTSDNIEVPIIEKKTGIVMAILDENTAQVMDNQTYETFEAVIDDEVKDKLSEGVEVTYWDMLGEKIIKQVKG